MRVFHYRKLALLFVIGTLCAACGGGSTPSTSTNSSPDTDAAASPSPLTDFEEALRFIRNGQFTYVYVISRKDGGPFTVEDSIFLKTNAPQFVDTAATKDRTKVVAGTNFNLEEGNMEALKRRFVVEDYSNR